MKRDENLLNEQTKPRKPRTGRIRRSVASVIGGSILTKEYVVKQLPFVFFLTFLAAIYINNNYASERTIIRIDRIKRENEVHRFDQILMKSKLMNMSSRSEVIKRLEGIGVKESLVPPQKIYVDNNNI